MHIETLAIHAGRQPDPATGAITTPIYLSTTFERAPDGSYPNAHIYTRESNPNRQMLEQALAALEGGTAALTFASGMAAINAVAQALKPGDHVLFPDDVYYGLRELFRDPFGAWGLQASAVDMTDLDAVKAALRPNTALVWVETPSNPMVRITDIAAVAALARGAGAQLVADATWTTPVLLRPLELGADMVMHATTKYLGGHSDLLGGALIAREETPLFERIRHVQVLAGAVPSPFDCWLLLRSLQSLPYRVRAQSAHAGRIAEFLAEHPAVQVVNYPGLESHPGHAIAAAQMAGFGAMMSIQMHGGEAAAMAVAAKVGLFTRGTSLGGVESLIEHRASVEGPDTPTPRDLLRLSIGLEHPDDLIADLAQALA